MDEDGFEPGEDIVGVDVCDGEVVDRLDSYGLPGALDGEQLAVGCEEQVAGGEVGGVDPLAVGGVPERVQRRWP